MSFKLKHLIFASLLAIASIYSIYGISKIVYLNIKLHSLARQIAYFEKPLNGVLSGHEIVEQIPDPYGKVAMQRALKKEFLSQFYHVKSQKVAENGRARFKVLIENVDNNEVRASASFPLLSRKNSTN